ncbi:MAG: hypothetical protein IH631_05200, partial [Candidatus Thorarchaeota archaeon]|nr:hypothetical protein [Candidatus Thorarchaeota archaeon]
PTIHTMDRTPSAPTEFDNVTINVLVTDDYGVDTVILSYHNGTTWFNVTMTWTGSDYEGVIPVLPNGTFVSYLILANDTSGNWVISGTSNYTVQEDLLAPTIHTIDRTPFAPTELDSVTINVLVTDDSGVDSVILSYHDGTTWFNVTMTWTGSDYEGVIPALPNGTFVSYRILANDTYGNWAISETSNYIVQDSTTTITTTTTTTATSITTTTTSSTTPDDQLDPLRLALLLTGVMILVVIYIVFSRRRPK